MTVTATPIFPQAINVGLMTILAADTQTYKTLFTAGANGSRVEGVVVTSTDTAARDITLNLTRAGTNYLLAAVSIPAGAGQPGAPAAVPSVDMLKASNMVGLCSDANSNKYIMLKSGDTLTINAPVSLTAAKVVTAVASGGDF